MAVLTKGQASSGWRKIELESGESFEVYVTRPSYAQRMQLHGMDMATLQVPNPDIEVQIAEHRLKACITNWRGVNDDHGKPVPFDWDAVGRFVEQAPELFGILVRFSREAFRGVTEDRLKNSESPSGETPAGTSGTATPSTPASSTNTTNASNSENSPESSAVVPTS